MLTILICALGLAILFAISFWTFEDSILAKLGLTIVGVFFGSMIGALVGVLLALMVGLVAPQESAGWVKTNELKLIAFNDGQSVSGNFFLGCGSIEGKSVYLYYTSDSDGGIRQGRRPAENSIIYEQDRKDGVLETYKYKVVFKGAWQLWGLPNLPNDYVPHYKFRVPKGTVVRQFEADLE